MSLSIPSSNTLASQSSKVELIEKKSDMILTSINAKCRLQEELDILDKKCQKIFSDKKTDCDLLIQKNKYLETRSLPLKREVENLLAANKELNECLKGYTSVNDLSKNNISTANNNYYKTQERANEINNKLIENMASMDQKIERLENALLVRNVRKKIPGLF